MTQTVIPGRAITPAAFVDAQVLGVPAATHTTLVQALGPTVRTIGQQLFSAVNPIDLIPPFLSVPTILSPDARLARVMRGH